MIPGYKGKIGWLVSLGYLFMLIPMVVLGLSSEALGESGGGFSSLLPLLVMAGMILMVIGCRYWSVAKGYSPVRGVFVGFFLNFFAPIVMALHRDQGVYQGDPEEEVTEKTDARVDGDRDAERLKTCPRCGAKVHQLIRVIDSKTMEKKELCSRCAEETMGPAALGINLPGGFAKKK